MKANDSKLKRKRVLRSAALAVGCYAIMVVASSLWITGGNSLFYTGDSLRFIWYVPVVLILVRSKCVCRKAKAMRIDKYGLSKRGYSNCSFGR